MQKVLITGINGLAGSFIAQLLVQNGYQVFGLARPKSDLSLLKAIINQIEIINGDILEIDSLDTAIEGKDWVIHCAGLVSYHPKDRNKLYKINVEGTANVVNVCLEKKIGKLLHMSSVAAVGKDERKLSQTITETNPWKDSPETSTYALSKYQGELEVWRGIAEGLQAVIVNPSVILGEADWQKTSTRLFKYVFDQNLFYTTGHLNVIDAKDLAEVCLQLLKSDVEGERFIVSSYSIPVLDFFTKLAKNFNKKAPTIKIGPFASSILWRIEHWRSLLLGTEPLITRETADSAKKSYIYSSEKVQKQLNFHFSALDHTLKRICENLQNKA